VKRIIRSLGVLVVGGALVMCMAAVKVPASPPTAGPRSSMPALVANHTLSAENCGASRGRQAWHVGSVQCNLNDSGAIVAIHRGGAAVTYTGTPVQQEIDYVDANWYTQGSTNYAYIPNEDCANFVSEALHSRGWAYTKNWHPATSTWTTASIDWVSSTHLRGWILKKYPAITELKGTAAFSQVKVGDVAQFDWRNTGIRDHTAIVTAVFQVNGVWQVYVGEHTDPYEYRNVRDMVTRVHPGATVYFLSLGSS
jgi:hypothetical protein